VITANLAGTASGKAGIEGSCQNSKEEQKMQYEESKNNPFHGLTLRTMRHVDGANQGRVGSLNNELAQADSAS
jgi:hypothetical protein